MTIRATSDRAQRICKALGFPPNPFERAPHKSAYEVLFHTRLEIAYFFSFSFALWFYMGLSPLAPTQGQQGDFKIAMTCIFLLVSHIVVIHTSAVIFQLILIRALAFSSLDVTSAFIDPTAIIHDS